MIASPFVSPIPPIYPGVNVVREQPKVKIPGEDMPRYINYLADLTGCGHWRIIWPENIINIIGAGCSTSLTTMVLDPRWYRGMKCIKIQRQATENQKEFVSFLKSIQKECGFKLVYEVDDVVFKEDIPDYNKFKFAFDCDKIRQNCIDIINMCDEITVTCEYMKRLYQQKTGKKEITVVPNFVPNFWLGHLFDRRRTYSNFDKHKRKPRILYPGSGAHYDIDNKVGGKDDFEELLKFIVDTRTKYQWVFMGSFPPPLRKYIEDRSIEFHPWQNLLMYPRALAALEVQAMIAPLQDNTFNRSKSDIKFLEAATLGIPCLCQDMVTYSSAPSDLRFSNEKEFEEKLDRILNYKNKNRYYRSVDELRKIGESRILELPQNIGCHLEVLNTPWHSPERKYLNAWN